MYWLIICNLKTGHPVSHDRAFLDKCMIVLSINRTNIELQSTLPPGSAKLCRMEIERNKRLKGMASQPWYQENNGMVR